jgi:hypothetical protein
MYGVIGFSCPSDEPTACSQLRLAAAITDAAKAAGASL